MKIDDCKIREDLQHYALPPYARDKMQKTLKLCGDEYRERLLTKRIGFREFIAMQVHYIGCWIWLLQAVLLLLFLFLFSRFHLGEDGLETVYLLLSLFAPVIAFVGFPEILKSYAHGMAEIEASTRFSMRKLMGARMMILGLADLCALTILLAISAAGHAGFMLRMILYLFVPFNLTCCICITMLNHVKSRFGGYYCGALCVFCMAVFYKLAMVKSYYEAAATGIWGIMLMISLIYLAIEIRHVFQSFDRICFYDEIYLITWE